MKEISKRILILHILFGFAIALWLVAVLGRAAYTAGNQIEYTEGRFYECADGWYDDEGNKFNIEKYVFSENDLNKETVLHYRVPEGEDFDGDTSLCFYSRGMNFDVYSEGEDGLEEIFSYDQEAAKLSGTDIGLTVHVVPLCEDDTDNEITIAITPTEISAFILHIRIEKTTDYILGTIRSIMPDFLGSVLILFFGISTIVYTLFAVDRTRNMKTCLYAWGAFSMALGILLIIQSQMIQVLTGRPEFWTTLKYALCLIMCYLLALVADSATHAPHKRFSGPIGYAVVILLIIETIGAVFNVLSFYRLWYLAGILNLITFVFSIVCLVKEIRYDRDDKEDELSVFMLIMVMINFVAITADLSIYARNSRHMLDWAKMTRFSYLAIIFFALIILLRISIRRNRKAMLVDKYKTESKAKSSFLANMSHEIRTPINAILGMNEMILRESEDDEIVTYASNVKTAGNTLLGIVNDILDFSKIEAGKMEIIPVEYDMSSVINDLVNMIQTKADSKGLALNIQMDKDIPKMLKGDEVRIKQVITNILSNAVKYTEKGSVTFGISSEKIPDESDAVILNVWVKDTGIGIKKEDMKKLFLEFDRIDEEKNRHIEGTGLGMNITQRLLEMMGSTLNVESEYGHGSTFSFRLKQDVLKWIPLGDYEKSYRNSLSERKKYKEKFIAPKAEVLMVDDNEMNRVVFQSLIKKTKVNIDLANDGDEGLSMLRKKKYDIVFLDHLMPGKDGVETLRELKAEPENPNIDTPMVCLTANAISGARGQYLSAGFNDYLSKPIDPDALEAMLMIYLPEDKVEYPNDEEDNKGNVESSSADEKEKLSPLSDNEHIDIDKGMNISGTVDVYLSMLKIYYNSIDEKEKELEAFLSEEDYKNYTVKVHALKSSLRTIGAVQLGEEAQALEDAGKREDTGFIKEHHKSFMEKCMSLKAPLSEIFTEEENDIDKPIADPELLAKAYEEIKAAAEDMDCGKLETIFEDMDRYGIPEKDAELWKKLRAASEAFDYSAILELL